MRPHPIFVVAVFLWNVVLPDVQAMSLLNRCNRLCDEERRAKSDCMMQRNCLVHMFNNRSDKFLTCSEPCSKIGNCFQRCALGADLIQEECEELCDGMSPCYDDCYNHRINQRMNTVFTKRPILTA